MAATQAQAKILLHAVLRAVAERKNKHNGKQGNVKTLSRVSGAPLANKKVKENVIGLRPPYSGNDLS